MQIRKWEFLPPQEKEDELCFAQIPYPPGHILDGVSARY